MNLPFGWLADVLRTAGLDVVEFPGWQARTAKKAPKTTWGVLCHHDAAPPSPRRKMVTPAMIAYGHSRLPGPIAQLCITDDARVHVIAAGTANHAGTGRIPGTLWIDGNARLLGIEVNNSGVGEQWAAALLEVYATTVAACLGHLGLDSSRAIAHKEYTSRKIDPAGPWDPAWRFSGPGLSTWAQMGRWREIVATRMRELAEPPAPTPTEDDMPQPIPTGPARPQDGRTPFLQLITTNPGVVEIVGHNGAKVIAPVDADQAEAFGRQVTRLAIGGRVLGWSLHGGRVVIATDTSATYTVEIAA